MSFDSAYCESIIHNLSTTGCVMIVFFFSALSFPKTEIIGLKAP